MKAIAIVDAMNGHAPLADPAIHVALGHAEKIGGVTDTQSHCPPTGLTARRPYARAIPGRLPPDRLRVDRARARALVPWPGGGPLEWRLSRSAPSLRRPPCRFSHATRRTERHRVAIVHFRECFSQRCSF